MDGLEVDAHEWRREIERRVRQVLAGETAVEDWDVVEERILDKLAKR